MTSVGVFASWQHEYAAHGISTFPVKIIDGRKIPAVKGYLRVGPKASGELASKFMAAEAIGFAAGRRNGLTVLDVDATDERILSDALDRHGRTPIIVRTASGKFHAWYRHHGERRSIRPWRGLPIDLLGAGFAVAPPSMAKTGAYEIIAGKLDDLADLPIMRGLDATLYAHQAGPVQTSESKSERVGEGKRNAKLWEHCMRQARSVDDLETMLDVAVTFNESCDPPLASDEVTRAAISAWDYTRTGRNRFGQHGAYLPTADVNSLVAEPDVLVLLMFLRANNGPHSKFMVANGLASDEGGQIAMTLRRLRAARGRLLELGYVEQVRMPRQHRAGLFLWRNTERVG